MTALFLDEKEGGGAFFVGYIVDVLLRKLRNPVRPFSTVSFILFAYTHPYNGCLSKRLTLFHCKHIVLAPTLS